MIDLSALFGGTGFLSSLFGNNKKTEKPAVQTPVTWAAQQGPTGYTDAMRANLGLDVQQGGQSPTSGMADIAPNAGTPYWYDPIAAQANPLQALLGAVPLPTPPAPTPTTPTPTTPTAPTTPQQGRGGLSGRLLSQSNGTNRDRAQAAGYSYR